MIKPYFRPPATGPHAAFTLVELLVVVGIIAVLVAILMPALARTREQARRAACASNLRQQGAAMHAYANDFDGDYPLPANPGPPVNPIGGFHWPMGAMSIEAFYSVPPSQARPAGQGVLYARGIVRDWQIFYCPSGQVFIHGIEPETLWDPSNWFNTYVGYPYWVGYRSAADTVGALPRIVATKRSDPGDRVMASDLITSDLRNNIQSLWNNHLGPDRKKAGGNFLFNDGSVQWRRPDELQIRLTHTGDNVQFPEFWLP